jgi:hypothetical protein
MQQRSSIYMSLDILRDAERGWKPIPLAEPPPSSLS